MRRDSRTVAQRLFAVFDAFGLDDEPTLTLTELAQRVDVPLSTMHRLAEQCVAWGGLERNADGSYQLGLKLWKLGLRYPDARAVRQVSVPFLQDLYELTHQNVQLAVRDGFAALYMQRYAGRSAVRTLVALGRRVPLHSTAVGLMLLAHAGEGVLTDVIAAGPKKFMPATTTTEAELRARLAGIRAAGIAKTRDEMSRGTAGVAAPIRDRTGRVIAALSVICSSAEPEDPQYPLAVQVTGNSISRALGWQPGLPSDGSAVEGGQAPHAS